MKINNSTTNLIKQTEIPNKIKISSLSSTQTYNTVQTPDSSWKLASKASFGAGMASILMQQCPVDIQDEINEDLCKTADDSSSIVQTIKKRFPTEECIELLRMDEQIEYYPDILKTVINAQNEKDDTPRFNGHECAEICQYAETIDQNPRAFELIFNAQNKDKSPRFSSIQCCELLNIADTIQRYPNAFEILLNITDNDKNPVLSSYDCIEMMKNADIIEKTRPALADIVINANLKNSPFDPQNVIAILKDKAKEIDNQEIEELPTRDELKYYKLLEDIKKYTVYSQIEDALNSKDTTIKALGDEYSAKMLKEKIQTYPELFKKIIDMINDDITPRFSDEECIFLAYYLSTINKHQQKFEDAAKIKVPENYNAFDAKQCIDLLDKKYATKENMNFLINITDNYTGKQRFSASECVTDGFDNDIKDKKAFKKTALIKNDDRKYRFNLKDCFTISNNCTNDIKKYPKAFKILYKHQPEFSADEIALLMASGNQIERFQTLFNNLCEMKIDENPRFDGYEIYHMMKNADTIKKNLTKFRKILNETNEKGLFLDGYDCVDKLLSSKQINFV